MLCLSICNSRSSLYEKFYLVNILHRMRSPHAWPERNSGSFSGSSGSNSGSTSTVVEWWWCKSGSVGWISGSLGCINGSPPPALGCSRGSALGCMSGSLGCMSGSVGCMSGSVWCMSGSVGCIDSRWWCRLLLAVCWWSRDAAWYECRNLTGWPKKRRRYN